MTRTRNEPIIPVLSSRYRSEPHALLGDREQNVSQHTTNAWSALSRRTEFVLGNRLTLFPPRQITIFVKLEDEYLQSFCSAER